MGKEDPISKKIQKEELICKYNSEKFKPNEAKCVTCKELLEIKQVFRGGEAAL